MKVYDSLRMVRINYNVCDITEANSDLGHYALNDRLIENNTHVSDVLPLSILLLLQGHINLFTNKKKHLDFSLSYNFVWFTAHWLTVK